MLTSCILGDSSHQNVTRSCSCSANVSQTSHRYAIYGSGFMPKTNSYFPSEPTRRWHDSEWENPPWSGSSEGAWEWTTTSPADGATAGPRSPLAQQCQPRLPPTPAPSTLNPLAPATQFSAPMWRIRLDLHSATTTSHGTGKSSIMGTPSQHFLAPSALPQASPIVPCAATGNPVASQFHRLPPMPPYATCQTSPRRRLSTSSWSATTRPSAVSEPNGGPFCVPGTTPTWTRYCTTPGSWSS